MDRLVTLNDFSIPNGGATLLAVASALAARKASIPVTYFTSDGAINPTLIQAGIEVRQISGNTVSVEHKFESALDGLYQRSVFNTIQQWIAENDTPGTVYHLHNWSHFLSPSVFHALRAVSPRLILTLHDFFLSCPNGAQYSYTENKTCSRTALSASCLTHNCDRRGYADKLWRSARHITRKRLFNLFQEEPHIVVIHEGMIPSLLIGGVPEASIEIIRNPIMPFTAAQINVEPNKEVLFIGRISYEKGPDLAIRAAQIAGVPIRLIGNGPMKADLMKEAPQATFEGWSDRGKISELSRNARMLVMPSRWAEPYGMVAGEALWSGLPVVLSNNAFIAEEIVQAGAGISCDVANLDEFSRAISEIAQDDGKAVSMSKNAYYGTTSIGNTLENWERRHIEMYTARLSKAERKPREVKHVTVRTTNVGIFNVKNSPNLGDGLIAICLERALAEFDSDAKLEINSIDLAARTGFGSGDTYRLATLKFLDQLPSSTRHAAVFVPSQLKLHTKLLPYYNSMCKSADAIIIGGGNLFSDIDLNFPLKLNAALNVASRNRLPVSIFGIGVSQDWSPRGIDLVRKGLDVSDVRYVTVRDELSKTRFDRLFSEAAGMTADIVFDPGFMISKYRPRTLLQPKRPVVGLNITSAITLRYHSDVKPKDRSLADWYVALCRGISDAGHSTILFSNGSPEDDAFLNRLIPRVREIPDIEIRRPSNPYELADIISGLSCLIAHRMHAIITAYSYQIPFIPLAWDVKIESLLEMMGLQSKPIEAVTTDIKEILNFVSGRINRKDELFKNWNTVLDRCFQGVTKLAEKLQI